MSHKRLNIKRQEVPAAKRLDLLKKPVTRAPCCTGDRCLCGNCPGRLKVYSTEPIPAAGIRIWYLHCNVCGHRPENNKVVVPLKLFPVRIDRRPPHE